MIKGKCLYGETEVEVDCLSDTVIICHCSMCRRQAGGPLFFSNAMKDKSFTLTKGADPSIYPSSERAERAFCKVCGTFIYMYYKEKKNTHFNVELFDDMEKTHVRQIHLEDKPAYYDLSSTRNDD